MKLILQHDQRDCGAVCLSMISAFYGLKQPISKYRELTKTDKSGTNLYGLVDGAKKIGLEAEALSGSPEELEKGIRTGEIRFPLVAHIVSEGALLHYIVVYGMKNGRFLIADPAKGKRKETQDQFYQIWTGYIVTFQKTDRFIAGDYTKGGFHKFFRLLRGQYGKLASVFILSLVVALIGIMGTFVFQLIIDNFVVGEGYYEEAEEAEAEHDHGSESALDQALETVASFAGSSGVHKIFLAVIGLYLLQSLIQFIRGALIVSMSKKIDIRLALSYYNHIVDLPVSSVSVRQTGEYLSRFSDTASIRTAISGATITLLLDSVMVIACGVILYVKSPRMFCVSLLMVLFYAVIITAFRKPLERSNRQVMESDAQLQSYFKESIDGIETIKAACANQQIKDATTGKFSRFIHSVVKNSLLSLVQDVLADTVELVGTVLILWIGFAIVLTGQITIGTLVTFYMLLAYFTQPIKNLIELQPTLQTAFVAADRLNDILDLQCEHMSEPAQPLPDINRWDLRHVDFRYGNRELTLQDVSMSLHRGEIIAIVGESGSGKTTLAKLFLRFYDPEAGEIQVDGTNIQEIDLHSIRQCVAYVSQNTFLFSDTIRNNLKLGNPDISDAEVEMACQAACADEYIRQLPLGYDTPLDENGVNLSGGQRQRLAIARALLKKPQLLILDEATSNLDTITEFGIKNTIFNLHRDLTCIIIAHRLSTIKKCDRIYVMERGKIAEAGTHDELLQMNDKYSQLWK